MSYYVGDYFIVKNRQEFDDMWDKRYGRFNSCSLTLKSGYVSFDTKNIEEKFNSIVFPLCLKQSYPDPRCCGDYIEVSKEEVIEKAKKYCHCSHWLERVLSDLA